jgi:hypothetical protein
MDIRDFTISNNNISPPSTSTSVNICMLFCDFYFCALTDFYVISDDTGCVRAVMSAMKMLARSTTQAGDIVIALVWLDKLHSNNETVQYLAELYVKHHYPVLL